MTFMPFVSSEVMMMSTWPQIQVLNSTDVQPHGVTFNRQHLFPRLSSDTIVATRTYRRLLEVCSYILWSILKLFNREIHMETGNNHRNQANP